MKFKFKRVKFTANGKNPIKALLDLMFNNLGIVVKVIAFLVCFIIMILSLLIAFFLFKKSILSIAISLAVIIFGVIIAAIIFFPIYAIGHIVSQNNEILEKLNK